METDYLVGKEISSRTKPEKSSSSLSFSALPTYFLTVFKLPKWTEKEIDRYRRSFLWRRRDPENVKGGHCLVKWKHCTRPRKLGGLGIKNLDHFGRALRLRWLWHSWDRTERPWKHLLKHHDKVDRELFFTSTTIEIGDGKKHPLLGGEVAPRYGPQTACPKPI